MQEHALSFTNSAGTELHGLCWEAGQTDTVVVFIHGQGEHGGRYRHVAEYFSGENISCLTIDHAGHGKSGGKKGHVTSYQEYLDSVSLLLAEADRRFDGKPVFVYGHSMGGNIVLNYALRSKPAIAGCIVTGTYIRLAFDPPAWKLKLAGFVKGFWPAYQDSNELDANALSKDPAVVEAYKADPFVHDRITVGALFALQDAANYAMAHASELSIPTLVMHGEEDKTTACGGSEDFAKAAGGIATFKGWKGLYHEIHNEPEQRQVFDYTLGWIRGILKT